MTRVDDNRVRRAYLAGMNEMTPLARPERVRKPDWIRVKAPTSAGFAATRELMRSKSLTTVCEEAACPNIGECWSKKHATVMILGDTCTRACAFCNVKTGMPRAVDPMEPQNVADAAAQMGLQHIVITSVDRDDLPDGGAKQFVKVIEAIRKSNPVTTIEILTPDFRNKHEAAVEAIVAAANPAYADAAGPATILVAACVVVTAILVPIVTAWTAKVVGRGADEAEAPDGEPVVPAPVRRA